MFDHARFNVILAKRPLMPWIVFVLCVALTLVVFLDARDSDRLRLWLHLKSDVETWGDMLERDVEISVRSVEHLGALLDAMPEVDRSIFKGVAATIRRDHKAIRALEWIPRVPHDRRSEYEAAARRDGFPGFQFAERSDGQNMIQAGRRDEYFPVYFVEPYEDNATALGYDLASESVRKETLETARDSSTICATQPITLVQQGKDQRAILLAKPVYHGGKVADSTAARRKNLKGYILVVIDMDDIAGALVAHRSRGPLRFSIHDMDAPPSQRLIYTHSPRLGQANKTSLLAINSGAVTDLAYAKVVKVANRTWTLVCSPSADNAEYASSFGPWFLLFTGGLLSTLVCTHLKNQLGQTQKVSALVETRTQELTIANQLLRSEMEIRRNAEAALARSEANYRIIADNTYDWEYWMGPEKQLLYCSPSCKRITGRLAGEFIADSQLIERIIHPEDREAYAAHVEQTTNYIHTAPSELVFRVIHRDGSVRWIQHVCQEARDLSGKTIGRRASNRDITESKVAGEMLRLSEENLLAFFNTIHDMLFVLDEEGKILRVNKTVTERLGYAEEELICRSVLDMHPETQRAEAGRTVADMLAGKEEFCPVPLLTKKGKLIPVETRVTRGQWNHRPALFGTCKDVTALQISEEKFAKAFRVNPSPMAITSLPDRCFMDVNEAFLMITGYTRSEVIGSTSEKLGLFTDPKALENSDKILAQDGRIRDVEMALRRKNGDIRYGMFFADVVELQHGRILLSVMHDITERKRTEGRERARQQVLEMLAANAPLKTILEFIVRFIEKESPSSIASILLTDRDGKRLRHGAAPSLPDFYNDAVDGLEIADGQGSCGTAAATSKIVIAEDVQTHPNWVPYRDLARRANVRACWSEPMLSMTGQVLGTFAIYYRTPHSPDSEERGRIHYAAGITSTVVEHYLAAEAIRRTQERFLLLIEHSPIPMAFSSNDGATRYINRQFTRVLGYALEELPTVENWWLLAYPDADKRQQNIARWKARMEKASEPAAQVPPDEFEVTCKDGSVRAMEISGIRVYDGVLVTFVDLTARKQMENDLRESEEKFRLTTTTARDAIVMLDSDGKVTFWNKAAEEMLGYSSSEAMGQELHPWLAPERYHDAYRNGFVTFQSAGTGAAVGKTLELTVVRKDGVEVPVELSVSVTQFGGRWHALAIMRDVTERHRVMEDLRQSKEGADAANKAKSQFLARMSHEIRTPLNAVLGFTQLLLRDANLAESHRNRLEAVRSNGEHLLALITDVLDMSKIETGRLTLQTSSFDLLDLLEDVKTMFRARAQARQLQFGMEAAAGIPRYVCGDRGKIQQVFVNLIGNAVKFTSRGGVMVRVREAEEKRRLQRIQVEIEDTGRGISPQEINQLFQPFAQAGKNLRSGGGSGLGLYISRQFAQLMGGDISATSQVGVGSLFRFDFVVELSTASAALEEMDTRLVKTLRPGQPPCRVLIVDDVQDNRVLLDQMLSQAGFVCFQATNGFNALMGLKEWKPHLILMDVHMPGMDGNETVQRIRAGAEERDVKIIGVTACAFEADRQAMLAVGTDGFLAKPIRQESLFAQIKALLGVEYLYEDEPATTARGSDSSQPGLLTRESMASLPAALLKQIHEAVVIADFDRVMELIQQVETQVPPVAHSLRQLAQQFDSETLLELTETT